MRPASVLLWLLGGLALLRLARVIRPMRYFTIEELTGTQTGIPNDPPAEAVANLRDLVAHVLDPWRDARGAPLYVSSGYRSEAVNAAVHGADDSQHTRGEAADIYDPGLTSEQLAAEFLALGIPFDQLVWYDDAPHVHVSWTERRPLRGEVLARLGGSYVAQGPMIPVAIA